MGKGRFFTTACLLLLFCLPSMAAQDATECFSVGIVALDARLETLAEMVSSRASRFGGQIFIDENEQMLIAERWKTQVRNQRDMEISRAYASHDETQVQRIREEASPVPPEEHFVLPVCYFEEPYDSDLAMALQANDDALAWFASLRGYDALILLSAETLSQFQRIMIRWYHPLKGEQILIDSLVQNSFYLVLEESFTEAILATTSKGNLGVLVFNDTPPGLSLSVDGDAKDLIDAMLFLAPGSHTFDMEAPGYVPMEVTVINKANTIQHLQFSFEEVDFPPIILHGKHAGTQWYRNGKSLGESLSISLSDPTYPMVLTLDKDGFTQKVVHLDSPLYQELDISQDYEELASPSLREESQRMFYKRLRNTILLFGSYIGCSVLSQMYETANPLWQVGLVGTSSLALVSTLAMAVNFSFYESMAGAGI